tara:strand:- start:939 stop:1124 length:186 start_codon:yes stop_codon:yes gene_type:complete
MVNKIKPRGSGIATKGLGKASDLLSQTPLDLLTQKMQRERILLEIQDTRLKNMKKEIKKTE